MPPRHGAELPGRSRRNASDQLIEEPDHVVQPVPSTEIGELLPGCGGTVGQRLEGREGHAEILQAYGGALKRQAGQPLRGGTS